MLRITTLITLLLSISVAFSQNTAIKGKVYDADSNQPLPFVNVVIKGTTLGVISSEDGTFQFTNVSPGFIRLEASFVGYETTISSEIEVSNARTSYIEIKLLPQAQNLKEIKVAASPYRTTAQSPLSLRTIGVSEIETAPGANRDLSRVIQSFPGIASPVSFRNDIIVRGGGPSENAFFLDDIEIPTINHFATQGASGGPVGIINADLVREVSYYSGAFPANISNALSGGFVFTQKDGNPDKMRFGASIGASEVTATLDGPLSKKTTMLFSARRSYLQLLFSALELPFLPTFNDVQFKIKHKINSTSELSLTGIGAYDDLAINTDIKDPDDQQQAILSSIPENHQRSYSIGASYKKYHENGHHTFVISRSYLYNQALKYKENDESSEANKILDYESKEASNKLRYENKIHNQETTFNYGAGLDWNSYNTTTMSNRFYNGVSTPINYKSDLNFMDWYLFAQANRYFANNRLLLSLSLRADANNYSSKMNNLLEQISPRFSASYRITPTWSVNFNTGKYFQLPALTTLGYKVDGKYINKENNIRYISAYHWVGGIKYQPDARLQLSGELFWKNYKHYPFSVNERVSMANLGADYGVVGNETVTSNSEGRAYGFELLLRLNTQKKLYMNASYTFVRSEFDDTKGNYLPSAWDSKHLFVATATKDLKRNWKLGAKFRFMGGLPYTPYDMDKSSLVEAWDLQGEPFLDLNARNSLRLGSFSQLDLRIDKYYYLKNITLKFYLDLQNALSSKSEEQDILVREMDENGQFRTVNNSKNYVLKRVKNEDGNVLPTIGVIVQF
ncbi:TonB-dependent receptor [Prolixibacteraceae bacterium JC049]|nr:TonB-dependent receptor [Prolixibacteraceae bacterium JC049]